MGTTIIKSGGQHDYEITFGDDWNPTWTMKDSAGALVNLTGYTAELKVRLADDTADPPIESLTELDGITLGGALGTVTPLITDTRTTAWLAAGYTKLRYSFRLISGGGIGTTKLSGWYHLEQRTVS